MRLKTTIFIEPTGKARPRTVRTKGGKVVTYTPEKAAHTENMIRDKVLGLGIYFEQGIPLRLKATFYRQRPKSLPKRVKLPTSRPDFDNYIKLLADALEKFVYFSDAQITTALIRKRFGEPPRIELEIEEDKEVTNA